MGLIRYMIIQIILPYSPEYFFFIRLIQHSFQTIIIYSSEEINDYIFHHRLDQKTATVI